MREDWKKYILSMDEDELIETIFVYSFAIFVIILGLKILF